MIMKTHSILLAFILLCACSLHAQSAIQWQKTFGGSKQDAAYAMQQTPDGGYLVTGFSNSNDDDFTDHHGTTTYPDMIVLKLDSTGAVQWKHSLGGSNTDRGGCLAFAHGGGYLVAGASASNDGDVTDHIGAAGVNNGWIVWLDENGTTIRTKSYGGGVSEDILRIVPTGDGGYVFAARSLSDKGEVTGHHGDTITSDYWVVKIDSIGNIIWEKSLGGKGFDAPFGLALTDDSAFVLTGDSNSSDSTTKDGDVSGNHGLNDIWTVKINDTGKIIWENSFGSSYDEDQNSIALASDGGYLIGGSSYGKGGNITVHYGHNDEYDIWVYKLARDGTLLWQKTLGGTGRDYEQDIHATSNGGCLVSGYSTSNDIDVSGHHGDTTNYDAWVVQLDSLGNIEWEKSLGGTAMDGASGIVPTSDGGAIFAGNTQSTDGDLQYTSRGNNRNEDCWIVKLTPYKNASSVDEMPIVANAFDLFPNPARSGATLQLEQNVKSDNAYAVITDILGNVRMKIHLNPGDATQHISFDVSQLSSGTYFASVIDSGMRMTVKILNVMK